MHVLAEGILKLEIAALLYMLCRKMKWGVTLDMVNRACAKYPWPVGHKPPRFRDVILEGRGANKDGDAPSRPKKGCHVHGSAGQILDFTLHSIELLRPFIQDPDEPVWRCWKVLVQILILSMHHTFTLDMVWKLDDLIQDHHKLFLSIPEYSDLFKPKHHFCAHLPVDILRFGPPRHYWCMRFEALNQVFKHIAMGGNNTETCKRCAHFFVMRASLNARLQLQREWGITQIISAGARETRACMPEISADAHSEAHTMLVRKFYEMLQIPPTCALQIQWVMRLAHGGHSFTAKYDWVYFQQTEKLRCNPWMLVCIDRMACIDDVFYVVLHERISAHNL